MNVFRNFLRGSGTLLLIFGGFYFILTGSPVPLFQIETLKNPIRIAAIKEDGLVTSEGRILAVKYINKLPAGLLILQDAVSDGVELNSDGYLIGRLSVLHWCGNDPVRYHLGKVNLTSLLILSGAETSKIIPQELLRKHIDLKYENSSLRIGDFAQIQIITSYIAETN